MHGNVALVDMLTIFRNLEIDLVCKSELPCPAPVCWQCKVCGHRFILEFAVQELDESEGAIVACLQDHRDLLHSSKCKDEVHKVMTRASEDIRFNQMLSEACLTDREVHCNNTQQVMQLSQGIQCKHRQVLLAEQLHKVCLPKPVKDQFAFLTTFTYICTLMSFMLVCRWICRCSCIHQAYNVKMC